MKAVLAMGFVALLLVSALPAKAVTFEWALIGNAGNTVDPNTGYGAVAYNYSISKLEVTNAQYAEFLNSVPATDGLSGTDPSLYNVRMESDIQGGISRFGMPGSYTYSAKPHMADKPVNFVSFFDAMRFVNWLHHGQGDGDTETGAYTIDSGTNEIRSNSAKFWIPSFDEWYKAAVHQPAEAGGDADNYWVYPTSSNSPPTIAMANGLGNISNPGKGVANYSRGADWNGANGNLTTVGSAGPESASFYGTFDQAGNVGEWNEAVVSSARRGFSGGGYFNPSFRLRADSSFYAFPWGEVGDIGFRVATIPVPEPNAASISGLASTLLLFRRWRTGG